MNLKSFNEELSYLLNYGSVCVEDKRVALSLISLLSNSNEHYRYEDYDGTYVFEIGYHLAH